MTGGVGRADCREDKEIQCLSGKVSKFLRGGTAMKVKMVVLFLGMIISGFFPLCSFAWDKATQGQIVRIDLTNAGNFPFRIILQGLPTLCTNGVQWAYLDDADGNYKVNVGAMLLAKSTGSDVVLFTEIDFASGFCRIGYFQVL
jgi:hypothetical protein